MKVCFVQPLQSPYWSNRLMHLAKHADIDVTLLLERAALSYRPGWEPIKIEGVKIEVLGSSLFRSQRVEADLGFTVSVVRTVPWRLVEALSRLRPDVVVVCNAVQALLAWSIRWLWNFKLVLMVEDTPHSVRGLSNFRAALKRFAYRRADAWTVFSRDSADYLRSLGVKQNVINSPWSLEIDRLNSNFFRNPNGVRTVVFVGQLIERKGVRALLEAWRTLPLELRRNARLRVIGDGVLRSALEEYCEKHDLMEVEFVGHLKYEKVMDALGQASLFVFPTLEDLYGLALLEAMACGCPIITSPFTGARELVEVGVNGWIVDPTAPLALSKALEIALSPETDLLRMGVAARASVLHMNNSEVMSTLADFLKSVAIGKL